MGKKLVGHTKKNKDNANDLYIEIGRGNIVCEDGEKLKVIFVKTSKICMEFDIIFKSFLLYFKINKISLSFAYDDKSKSFLFIDEDKNYSIKDIDEMVNNLSYIIIV